MDLDGVTVGQMREMASRNRLCPACQQMLAEAVEAGASDDDLVSDED